MCAVNVCVCEWEFWIFIYAYETGKRDIGDKSSLFPPFVTIAGSATILFIQWMDFVGTHDKIRSVECGGGGGGHVYIKPLHSTGCNHHGGLPLLERKQPLHS